MKKPIKKLPGKRKSTKSEPTPGTLGALLHAERQKRQISQQTVANVMAKKTGRSGDNVRVSAIELSKSLPSDIELGVLSSMYGLSMATLRSKRDAELKQRPGRTQTHIKAAWGPGGKRRSLLAPKPNERAAAKTVTRPSTALAVLTPEPAGPTELADWIEMVDTHVTRMPVEPALRRQWLSATIELFKLRGAQ